MGNEEKGRLRGGGNDQVVNRIFWFGFADFNEALCDGWHYMTHQIVPQRKTLGFQHLSLLSLNCQQLGLLCVCVYLVVYIRQAGKID